MRTKNNLKRMILLALHLVASLNRFKKLRKMLFVFIISVVLCIYFIQKYHNTIVLLWKLDGPFAWPIIGNAIELANMQSKFNFFLFGLL